MKHSNHHPKALVLALSLATLAAAPAAIAQTPPVTPPPATAATAQDNPQADYDALMKGVEETASALNTELLDLEANLNSAANSAEEADKRFASLKATLQQVEDQIGEKSQNWALVNQLMKQAEEERKAMLARYQQTNDQDYKSFADAWDKKSIKLREVRESILDERNQMRTLGDQLMAVQDKVKQSIKLKKFDIAIAKLESVRDRIKAMNGTMSTIVDATKQAAGFGH